MKFKTLLRLYFPKNVISHTIHITFYIFFFSPQQEKKTAKLLPLPLLLSFNVASTTVLTLAVKIFGCYAALSLLYG